MKEGNWAPGRCEWGVRRPHNEEVHSLYRISNLVRVIKSNRLIWAGHVGRMEDRSAFKILTGKPTGKRPLGRPRLDGMTILELTLKRWVSMRVIGLIRLRIGIIGGPCECGILPPGSIS